MARKAKLTGQLPATLVTPEMRKRVVAIAEAEEKSIGDVIRTAVSLFLSSSDSKAINTVRNATTHKAQPS